MIIGMGNNNNNNNNWLVNLLAAKKLAASSSDSSKEIWKLGTNTQLLSLKLTKVDLWLRRLVQALGELIACFNSVHKAKFCAAPSAPLQHRVNRNLVGVVAVEHKAKPKQWHAIAGGDMGTNNVQK